MADTAPYCFLLRGSIFFAIVLLLVNRDTLAQPILPVQRCNQGLIGATAGVQHKHSGTLGIALCPGLFSSVICWQHSVPLQSAGIRLSITLGPASEASVR